MTCVYLTASHYDAKSGGIFGMQMPKGYSTVKDLQNGASLIQLMQSIQAIK